MIQERAHLFFFKTFEIDDISILHNCTGGGMINVLASSAVDRRFEPRSGKTKEYTIGSY